VALKVLKPIGFDQNAMTTMSRRGDVVRKQADRTNAAFRGCGDVCHASLKGFHDLHLWTDSSIQVGR